MNSTMAKLQLGCDHYHTNLEYRNAVLDTSTIPTTTTIFQYQTHIEQRDCSVDDDITISFYTIFDTAKIVYTSSVDHRHATHPESDSFCSPFNFTTTTFPGLLLGPELRSCVFPFSLFRHRLSLCVGVSVFLGNELLSLFLFTAACYGRFCGFSFCFDHISIWHCILQPAACTL